jgi:aspartyl-tRNA(Asn)/glutamyl-tRNA(Gln) amidotransferase subunit A
VDDRTISLDGRAVHVGEALSLCTMIHNFLGIPALVLPIGLSKEGLPISAQIASRPFEDETILHLAHVYETQIYKLPPCHFLK